MRRKPSDTDDVALRSGRSSLDEKTAVRAEGSFGTRSAARPLTRGLADEHSSIRSLETFCNPGAGSSNGAEKANQTKTNPVDAEVGKRQSAYNRNISIHQLRFETS